MPRYDNERELRTAAGRQLGHDIPDDEWSAVAPQTSAPYDDYDLCEILDALPRDHFGRSFVEECERLGEYIAMKLEALHREEAEMRDILDASNENFRPLGEFWAWSWWRADEDQRRVITLRRPVYDDSFGDRLLSLNTHFYYHTTLEVLGIWEFFWCAVEELCEACRIGPCEVVANLFWPNHWTRWSGGPLWPDNTAKRQLCLQHLESLQAQTPRALRRAMEERIRLLHKEYRRTSAHPFSNHTKFLLLVADAAVSGNARWEEKRRYFESLRDSDLNRGYDTRQIATSEQFRVEVMRARSERANHDQKVADALELLHEMGPRWTLAGKPIPHPRIPPRKNKTAK